FARCKSVCLQRVRDRRKLVHLGRRFLQRLVGVTQSTQRTVFLFHHRLVFRVRFHRRDVLLRRRFDFRQRRHRQPIGFVFGRVWVGLRLLSPCMDRGDTHGHGDHERRHRFVHRTPYFDSLSARFVISATAFCAASRNAFPTDDESSPPESESTFPSAVEKSAPTPVSEFFPSTSKVSTMSFVFGLTSSMWRVTFVVERRRRPPTPRAPPSRLPVFAPVSPPDVSSSRTVPTTTMSLFAAAPAFAASSVVLASASNAG